MRRFVPNYTCGRVDETGITCVKVLLDYKNGVKIYEKEINDVSESARNVNEKITKDSPWSVPIIYDLASYTIHKKNTPLVIKESDEHVEGVQRRIREYSEEKRKELLEKGLKERVDKGIEERLIKELEERPVTTFFNFNQLYNERDAGLGWVVITEYNEHNNEFIIYDPLYYTRLPKGGGWKRIENTPKRRFITVNKNYLLKVWRKTKETQLIPKSKRKESVKPFIREFLTIEEI